jgi:arsenite-transporting ATPase
VHTLLFTGPGGAGTTTLAAAAAVRAARSGRRTLLLSRQGPPVPGLEAVAGLEVRTVAPQPAFERLWDEAAGAAGAVLPQLTLPPASSVVPLPGTAEIAVLTELSGADADLVVVDAGPLEVAVALVSLPATLQWWLDQVMPPGMRALAAVRTAAVAAGAARRGPLDAALDVVPVVETLLAGNRLADPSTVGVCLVAPARTASVAALRTAVTTLALHGHGAGVVLSRVLPLEGRGDWAVRRTVEQESALAALGDVGAVHRIVEGAVAPADVEELARLLDGFQPAVAASAAPVSERHDGAWRLTVALPFAERGDVHVTRWVDDLVVTVGTARRSLRLDAVLRRCEVTGGRLVEPGTGAARLEVGFRPDPQLWPPDLLTAEKRTTA